MRILVTGGAGFIGSHLCERLHGDRPHDHEVTVLDRRNDGCWRGSWTLKADCRFTLAQYGQPEYQFIYHLASTVGVTRVLADPKGCIDNIIDSTRAVLSLGVPGMYFSTSEVYGKGSYQEFCEWQKLKEDDSLILGTRMRWTYAGAKLIGEYLARLAGWKVVRLFNVVGPRQNSHYGAVLPRFVEQAVAGDDITVYGDGSQIRTFLDVRDCVRILDVLRDKEFDITNIGGVHTLTISELAELVKETLNSKSRIVRIPYDKAYPGGEFEECPARIPDLTRMRSLIGEFKFRDLRETITEIAKEKQCLTRV